eukprot:Blabericola_migrator_1__6267@NODE_3160_length_1990_cov_30_470619_g1978_i0_p1_GENE_NODE_3160_length_1990_cov_30_470619_g1978_i0NODE_3160_length_1990_cov_30_470619_g1978_i0_p1_ORF_typecomplete_len102_score4_47_NODE_3160_length_1990_cov_30_470619_g1978_i0187492
MGGLTTAILIHFETHPSHRDCAISVGFSGEVIHQPVSATSFLLILIHCRYGRMCECLCGSHSSLWLSVPVMDADLAANGLWLFLTTFSLIIVCKCFDNSAG